jgi:hypothetical protein
MDSMKRGTTIIIVIIIALIGGCATSRIDPNYTYSSAYLTITQLRDTPQRHYDNYKKYIHNGTAYVIVHPAYYDFFHKKGKHPIDEYVHRFISKQTKIERDFIANAIHNEELVLFILPGKWYSKEYVTYINDLTRGSESILFMESRNAGSGALHQEDIKALSDFFKEIGVTNVIVGGGYIGRCQNNVYARLSEMFGTEHVAIAPEISSFSPSDVSPAIIKMFTADGGIMEPKVISSFIRTFNTDKDNETITIRNLPLQ